MKIYDIQTDLSEDIDITNSEKSEIVQTKEKLKQSSDIFFKKMTKISLKNPRIIYMIDNATKNFDSLWKNISYQDIFLAHKNHIDFWKNLSIHIFQWTKNILTSIKKNYSHKKYALYIIIALICVYTDKLLVEHFVNKWYTTLISIKEAQNEKEVQKKLNDAKFDFIIWDFLYTPFKILPGSTIKTWTHVIEWWKELARFGDESMKLYSLLKIFFDQKWIENVSVTHLIENLYPHLSDLENILYDAYAHFWSIDSLGSHERDIILKKNTKRLETILLYIHTLNINSAEIVAALWKEDIKKYMVVFQNNDEIRPTGGFMWSTGLVSIYQWKIIDFEPSDIYAYEWDINKTYTDKIPAPEGLNKITPTFWLRDANYFLDIARSSETIRDFLKYADVQIDGVVYINQNIVRDILRILGWVEFLNHTETITADNFSPLISTIVEAKLSQKWSLGTPKQVLFDFQKEFFKALKEQKKYGAYIKTILEHIQSRDIFIYSFHPEMEKILKKLHITWFNHYSDTLDFSYPVMSSLSGNKSDRYIDTSYSKQVIPWDNCSIDTHLTITRRHLFNKTDEKELSDIFARYAIRDTETMMTIQWKSQNHQYIRILLPPHAIIEKQAGMLIEKHKYFQVVSFYTRTEITQTTENTIQYTLPNKTCRPYQYILYKQPGISEYAMNFSEWKNNFEIVWIKQNFIYNIEY